MPHSQRFSVLYSMGPSAIATHARVEADFALDCLRQGPSNQSAWIFLRALLLPNRSSNSSETTLRYGEENGVMGGVESLILAAAEIEKMHELVNNEGRSGSATTIAQRYRHDLLRSYVLF